MGWLIETQEEKEARIRKYQRAKKALEDTYRKQQIRRDEEAYYSAPKPKQTMHILHFILTILSGGLWILVWVLCGLLNMQANSAIDSAHNRHIIQRDSRHERRR